MDPDGLRVSVIILVVPVHIEMRRSFFKKEKKEETFTCAFSLISALVKSFIFSSYSQWQMLTCPYAYDQLEICFHLREPLLKTQEELDQPADSRQMLAHPRISGAKAFFILWSL